MVLLLLLLQKQRMDSLHPGGGAAGIEDTVGAAWRLARSISGVCRQGSRVHALALR
jgi:hypothetical protein